MTSQQHLEQARLLRLSEDPEDLELAGHHEALGKAIARKGDPKLGKVYERMGAGPPQAPKEQEP
jgi:hypothetical protein